MLLEIQYDIGVVEEEGIAEVVKFSVATVGLFVKYFNFDIDVLEELGQLQEIRWEVVLCFCKFMMEFEDFAFKEFWELFDIFINMKEVLKTRLRGFAVLIAFLDDWLDRIVVKELTGE